MLFKLEQNPERKGELMGYEWIEVLAIVPGSIIQNDPNHYARFSVGSLMLCNRPLGLSTIVVDDVFDTEVNEYILAKS